MARDILDDLFYGRLCPWEEMPQGADDISELLHRQTAAREKLDQHLDEATKALLTDYTDCRSEYEQNLYCHYFKLGFLMSAAFTKRTEGIEPIPTDNHT